MGAAGGPPLLRTPEQAQLQMFPTRVHLTEVFFCVFFFFLKERGGRERGKKADLKKKTQVSDFSFILHRWVACDWLDVQARKLTAPSAVCIYGAAPLQPDGAAAACVRLDSSRCASTAQQSGAKSAHPPTPSQTFRIKPLGKGLLLFRFLFFFVRYCFPPSSKLIAQELLLGFTLNNYSTEALNWCIKIGNGATMCWRARRAYCIVPNPINNLIRNALF